MAQQIPAEQVDQEINLFELLNVLVKRKMLILCITAAATVLSIGYSLMLKNIYTASASILPPQKDGGAGGLSAILGQAGGLASLAAGSGLGGGGSDLYVSILKSRSVADDVIKKLGLVAKFEAKNDDIARKKLAKIVKIQSEKNGIIVIAADDKDPVQAAALANTFVEELGKTTVRLNLSKVATEKLFLEKRLEIVKADMKKAEDELKAYSQQNKIVQLDAQAKVSIEALAKLKAELANREVQLSILRSYQTDENFGVKTLQETIIKNKQEIDKLTSSSRGGEGVPSLGAIPGIGLEYARKMRDVQVQAAVFEQLTKQYELAKLNAAKDSSSIQVLDSAVVPFQKTKPMRALIVLYTTVSAFFGSFILAFILEYFGKLPESDRLILENIKRQLRFSK